MSRQVSFERVTSGVASPADMTVDRSCCIMGILVRKLLLCGRVGALVTRQVSFERVISGVGSPADMAGRPCCILLSGLRFHCAQWR